MEPNVSNNCGIGSQRYTGPLDCAISAQAQHTKEIHFGPKSSELCTSKVRTTKPRWRVWSKAYGSGHLDQGLVKGLARKAHRQSENRESRGHKHCVIVNAETPMEGLATVTRRQVIWIVF
jgi:hypothetical protein